MKQFTELLFHFVNAEKRLQLQMGEIPVLDSEAQAAWTRLVHPFTETEFTLDHLGALRTATEVIRQALQELESAQQSLSTEATLKHEQEAQGIRQQRLSKHGSRREAQQARLTFLRDNQKATDEDDEVIKLRAEIGTLDTSIRDTTADIERGALRMRELGTPGYRFRTEERVRTGVLQSVERIKAGLVATPAQKLDSGAYVVKVQAELSADVQRQVDLLMKDVVTAMLNDGKTFAKDWSNDGRAREYREVLATLEGELARLEHPYTAPYATSPVALPDYLDMMTLRRDLEAVTLPDVVIARIREALNKAAEDAQRIVTRADKRPKDGGTAKALSKGNARNLLDAVYGQTAVAHTGVVLDSLNRQPGEEGVFTENDSTKVYEKVYLNPAVPEATGPKQFSYAFMIPSEIGADTAHTLTIDIPSATGLSPDVSGYVALAQRDFVTMQPLVAAGRVAAHDDKAFNMRISLQEIEMRRVLKLLANPKLTPAQRISALYNLRMVIDADLTFCTHKPHVQGQLAIAMQLAATSTLMLSGRKTDHNQALTDTLPLIGDLDERPGIQVPLPYADWEFDEALQETNELWPVLKPHAEKFMKRLMGIMYREGGPVGVSMNAGMAQWRLYQPVAERMAHEFIADITPKTTKRVGIGMLLDAYRKFTGLADKQTSLCAAAQISETARILGEEIKRRVAENRAARTVHPAQGAVHMQMPTMTSLTMMPGTSSIMVMGNDDPSRLPAETIDAAGRAFLEITVERLSREAERLQRGQSGRIRDESRNHVVEQITPDLEQMTGRGQATEILQKLQRIVFDGLEMASKGDEQVSLSAAHQALGFAQAYKELRERWVGKRKA